MATEPEPIDINDLPEVQRIAEEVQRTGEPRVLRWRSEEVAIVLPIKRARRERIPRGKPFTMDDPLWNLVGAGASGLGDVSQNKHKYLAEAYLPRTTKE